MPPSFDNIINKFKSSTKQAADQMQRAAKVARLKMDIMTLNGEKTRHLQTIGERTFALYTESNNIDGHALLERVRHEFTQIQRLDTKLTEIDTEIAELQAAIAQPADITEAEEVTDVTDTESGENK